MIRPYVPGDDVRRIDWNVTARTGEPHVRVDLAERVLVTWLVLDTSPSMQFGTADRRKADVAEGVAVAIGHLATRRGNRLGVVTFGDDEPHALPPRQGRAGLVGLLAALRAEPAEDGAGTTSLGEALTRTGALARQRSLVVVVSDFRGPHGLAAAAARARGPPRRARGRDPRPTRAGAPERGLLWLVDPETGRQLRVDTRSRRLRERFAVGGGGRARRGSRARSPRVGRPARRAHDLGRLAALARRLPAPEPRVSFDLADRAARSAAAPAPRRALRRARAAARRARGALREPRAPAERDRPRARPAPLPAARRSCSSRSRAMIVGVARPHATVSVPREEATVVLAIDVSRSMKATDVEPTRLDAARPAAKAFVDRGAREVPRRRRLVRLARGRRRCRRPRTERSSTTALDSLKPGEGTAIGDAVALSAQLGQQERRRGRRSRRRGRCC